MAGKLREVEVPRRGTTRFVIYASAVDADITDMVCSASLRELDAAETAIAPDTPVAVTLEVADFAGSELMGPGWYLTLTAALSSSLDAGKRYLADAKIEVNGEPYFTRQWIACVYEPAS